MHVLTTHGKSKNSLLINVFDFIALLIYIALITGNMLQPVLKIFEKG